LEKKEPVKTREGAVRKNYRRGAVEKRKNEPGETKRIIAGGMGGWGPACQDGWKGGTNPERGKRLGKTKYAKENKKKKCIFSKGKKAKKKGMSLGGKNNGHVIARLQNGSQKGELWKKKEKKGPPQHGESWARRRGIWGGKPGGNNPPKKKITSRKKSWESRHAQEGRRLELETKRGG